jgi:hypothetical protein
MFFAIMFLLSGLSGQVFGYLYRTIHTVFTGQNRPRKAPTMKLTIENLSAIWGGFSPRREAAPDPRPDLPPPQVCR